VYDHGAKAETYGWSHGIWGYAIVSTSFNSEIASNSGLNALVGGHVFAVLRAYFDGSKAEPPASSARSITLAGYVASDATWGNFEDGWRKVLQSHPLKPAYMHMKEAMFLRKGFSKDKGWTPKLRDDLLAELLRFVYEDQCCRSLYAVCCTLNVDDYDKARREGYPLRKPVSLCAGLCAEKILSLQYVKSADTPSSCLIPIESIDFFFDQGEPYLGCLNAIWNQHGGKHGELTTWGLVHQISPVEMRKNPSVQLADMLAWSRNRAIAIGGHVDLCRAILSATDSSEWAMDYEQIIKPHRRIV
jgi:hypothetical protein